MLDATQWMLNAEELPCGYWRVFDCWPHGNRELLGIVLAATEYEAAAVAESRFRLDSNRRGRMILEGRPMPPPPLLPMLSKERRRAEWRNRILYEYPMLKGRLWVKTGDYDDTITVRGLGSMHADYPESIERVLRRIAKRLDGQG